MFDGKWKGKAVERYNDGLRGLVFDFRSSQKNRTKRAERCGTSGTNGDPETSLIRRARNSRIANFVLPRFLIVWKQLSTRNL